MKIRKIPAEHGPFHTAITVIASAIALAGIGLGIWFFIIYSNYEETNDAQVDQYVTPVATRITGYVQQVRYEENQFVHRGDTLIVIDNREYRAHWGMATAEISNARHHVSAARKNAASTQSHVAVGQAQLDAARTLVWKTKLEYERYEALLHEEAATQQQVEKVRADYESAQAHYEEVNRNIRASELATSEALAQVPVAESMMEVRNAAADNAALYLSYTVITAPYDGWVGRKTIQPGQLVKEGQTLVSVVSREKWITANFKETQIADMTIGQPVTFKADASHGRTFKGRIESCWPATGARVYNRPPHNTKRHKVKIEQRIPVRIALTDPGSQTAFLRAGMNVTVTAAHQH